MTSFVQHSIAEKFGIDVPASLTIGGHEKPSPFTPATDSDYNFRVDLLRDILAWWRMKGVLNEGLLLTGPTGSGKTSVIDQVCARLNMPVQRTSSNPRLEMTDLLGSFQLIDGETIWIDGPLTTAYREGHLFLLDEMDILDPGMLKSLNGVVEGQPLTLPNGGEVVIQHPDFRFVGTANSNGSGDDTGLYTGALRQDLSFLDRFVVLEVSYQSPSEELVLLQKKGPAILKDYFERMIAVANDVRDRFIGNNGFDDATAIEVTMSTRTLIRWAHYTSAFQSRLMDGDNPFTYAMTRALGNRAKPETKAYLEELVQRHLPKEG